MNNIIFIQMDPSASSNQPSSVSDLPMPSTFEGVAPVESETHEKESKSRILLVAIGILLLSILAIGGYVVYDRYFSTEDENDSNGQEEDDLDCAQEGVIFYLSDNKECCAGLTEVTNYFPSEKNGVRDCIAPTDGSIYCVNCGDGICGPGENWCRCPEDCEWEEEVETVEEINGDDGSGTNLSEHISLVLRDFVVEERAYTVEMDIPDGASYKLISDDSVISIAGDAIHMTVSIPTFAVDGTYATLELVEEENPLFGTVYRFTSEHSETGHHYTNSYVEGHDCIGGVKAPCGGGTLTAYPTAAEYSTIWLGIGCAENDDVNLCDEVFKTIDVTAETQVPLQTNQ